MSDLLAFADAHTMLVVSFVLAGAMVFLGTALIVGEVIKAVYRR